ncbi:hypothetical protein BH20ACI2_BH20ACI2_08010 [soil metagenome]
MGASFVESFVNYPTWKLIGAAEFRDYHHALSPLIIGYMVVPVFFTVILTGLLLWKRPQPIPSWAIWPAILMQIIGAVSSFAIQIPIQRQLSSNGLSLPLIDQLIFTNFWFRRIPMFINSVLFFWMMSLLLRTNIRTDVDGGRAQGI